MTTFPTNYFRPDGVPYCPVPRSPDVLPDRLLPIWRRLQSLLLGGKPCTRASNKVLASLLKKSVSTVKRMLRWLIRIGAVEVTYDASKCRTIWLLIGVRASRRNPRPATNTGQKNLGGGGVKNDPSQGSKMAPPLSPKEEIGLEPTTAGGGESAGTDPPPASEEGDALPQAEVDARNADALAAILAQVQAAAAAPSPALTPRTAQESPAAARRATDALEQRTRALAAQGDPVAVAELASIEGRKAPAAADGAPGNAPGNAVPERAESDPERGATKPPVADPTPPPSVSPKARPVAPGPIVWGRSLADWFRRRKP